LVRIEQAKADGRLGAKPALEVALAFSALAQGLVSMYRAGRFSSERQFRTLYRAQIRQCFDGFSTNASARSR
jgi:hypothetical protein